MPDKEREVYKSEPEFEEAASMETEAGLSSDTMYFVEDDKEFGLAGGASDEDFEARRKKRKSRVKWRKYRRRMMILLLMLVGIAILGTMCGRDIIRLKSENRALQKQQKELEAQRDKLKDELSKSGKREYVQDQARKQLRLLNPGELLFTFDEEETQEEETPAENQEESQDKDKEKEKEEKSDG